MRTSSDNRWKHFWKSEFVLRSVRFWTDKNIFLWTFSDIRCPRMTCRENHLTSYFLSINIYLYINGYMMIVAFGYRNSSDLWHKCLYLCIYWEWYTEYFTFPIIHLFCFRTNFGQTMIFGQLRTDSWPWFWTSVGHSTNIFWNWHH